MANVCIIPARGGSKRIPGKNLRPFLGRPIISYSIEAALESGLFSAVVVSTDDQRIAEFSASAGAEVPFLRSAAASNDHASTADVLIEVLGRLAKAGRTYEFACCCYAAAPFVTPIRLNAAYAQLTSSDADCVIPVAPYSTPILRAYTVAEGQLQYVWPENQNKRSQDLPQAYFDTGQFYFFRVEKFVKTKSLISGLTLPLILSGAEVQDIDNEEDWTLAEMKYRISCGNLE